MMKRAKQTVAAAGRADGGNDAGGGDSPYNMSMDHVPAGWVEAQSASPIAGFDSEPLNRAARFSAVPTGQESTFIPNIAALGASFIGGISWFLAESQGVYNGPWLAIVVGAFIALAIRAQMFRRGVPSQKPVHVAEQKFKNCALAFLIRHPIVPITLSIVFSGNSASSCASLLRPRASS